MRLGLVPAWIFLISAEAIASTGGLGYRIFLVRRYLAMDVILPYVAWITLLAYALDRLLLPALAARLPLGASRREPACELRRRLRRRASATTAITVLGDVNLKVEEGAFVTIVGAIGLRQVDLPAPPPQPGAADARARSGSAASRSAAEPTPDRGIVFQRYSVFPHLTVTENLILPLEFERARGFGRTFGAARRKLRDEVEALLDRYRPRRGARPLPGPALRRHAAAPRHRPGAPQEAEGAAPRRAVRRARSRHPRATCRS